MLPFSSLASTNNKFSGTRSHWLECASAKVLSFQSRSPVLPQRCLVQPIFAPPSLIRLFYTSEVHLGVFVLVHHNGMTKLFYSLFLKSFVPSCAMLGIFFRITNSFFNQVYYIFKITFSFLIYIGLGFLDGGNFCLKFLSS